MEYTRRSYRYASGYDSTFVSRTREMSRQAAGSTPSRSGQPAAEPAVTTQRREAQKPNYRSILHDPRLQQVTGVLPRKMSTWDRKEIPADDVALLYRAITMQDYYVRRPRLTR